MALFTLLGASLYAQTDPQVTMLAPSPQTQADPVKLSPEDLNQLLAPIALYPDALIALILPASTVPSDVVMGARYIQANGNPDQVINQPWDDSVKSLTRYPDVLAWMDKNLDWTTSVGEAFVTQPADVMNAVQALRAKAKAAGNLVDTPQQKVVQEVVKEREVIRIVPADPEVIYVPQYDPQVVYVESYQPAYSPLLTFGLGFAVGSWLNYDFDWGNQCFYRGNWRGWNHNNWDNNGGYNNNNNNNNYSTSNVNVTNITNNNVTQWQPSAASRQQLARRTRNHTGNARIANATVSRTDATGATQADVTAARRSRVPKPTNYTPENRRNRPAPTDVAANEHGYRPGPVSPTATSVESTRPAVNTVPGVTPAEVSQNPRNRRTKGDQAGSVQGSVTPSNAPNVDGQLGKPGSVSGNPDRHRNHVDTATQPGGSASLTPAPAVSGNDLPRNPKADIPQNAPVVPGQVTPPDNTVRPQNNADKPNRHHVQPSTPPPLTVPSSEKTQRNRENPSSAPQQTAPAPDKVDRHHVQPSAAPEAAPKMSAPAPEKVDRHNVPSTAPVQSSQHYAPVQQTPSQPSHHSEAPQSKPAAEDRHHNSAPAQSKPDRSSAPSSHQQQSQPQQQAHPKSSAPAPTSNQGNHQKADKKKDKDNS